MNTTNGTNTTTTSADDEKFACKQCGAAMDLLVVTAATMPTTDAAPEPIDEPVPLPGGVTEEDYLRAMSRTVDRWAAEWALSGRDVDLLAADVRVAATAAANYERAKATEIAAADEDEPEGGQAA